MKMTHTFNMACGEFDSNQQRVLGDANQPERGIRTMNKRVKGLAFCIVALTVSAAAQTVTAPSPGGTNGTVPVFTGSTTLENSWITLLLAPHASGTITLTNTLNVPGQIESVLSGTIGPTFMLVNPSKTTAGTAYNWNIYNMTAGYGNSLQFWDYDTIGCTTGGMCSSRLTIMDSGNVGIGTTAPAYKLDVAGQIHSSTGYVFPDGSVQATAFNPVGTGSGTAISETNGSVGIGIGTTTPGQLLQVGSTYSQNPSIMIGGHDSNNSDVGTYSILFGAWRDVEPTITSGIVATPTWTCCGGYPASGTGSYPGIRENTLGFYTIYDPGNPTNYSPNMLINTNGNVGIGTTSPGAKLEVDGNVKLTSGSGASITFQDSTVQSTAYTGVTCGGDYAESVDVSGRRTNYEAGDLLVIDPGAPGKFLKSAQAYSTLVAGIYSTKPGMVGRRQTASKSPDEVPMAMMGIVPTKVTAENGPIKTGDLLVTSSILGRAMKGTDRGLLTGAVVGKALGSLDSGTGVIEVLVTLQ